MATNKIKVSREQWGSAKAAKDQAKRLRDSGFKARATPGKKK